MGKPPLGLKQPNPSKPRKGMRKVSAKKAAYRASSEGKADLEYMGLVRQLPCCTCGSQRDVDAHHCRDTPPADDRGGMGPYSKLPGAGMKSGALDTIPLCHSGCHMFGPNSYHDGRAKFHELHGNDYSYIEQTRKLVGRMFD